MDTQTSTQSGVAAAGGQSRLSLAGGVAALREKMTAPASQEKDPAVSQAASTLGKLAAAKRAEARQAQPEQTPEQQTEQVDTQPDQLEDTTTTEPSTEGDPEQSTAEEATIEIGNGRTLKLSAEDAEEIRKGYLRQANFSVKTEALAKEKQAFQAESSQKLSQLNTQLAVAKSLIGEEPNWLQRANEVGGEQAFREQLEWNQRTKAISEIEQSIVASQQQELARAAQNRDQVLAEQYNSDWLDPGKRNEAYNKIANYAVKLGIPATDLAYATHPAYLMVLDKAMQFDELKSKPVKEMVKDKPSVNRPGPRQPGTVSPQMQAIQQAKAAFDKAPTIANALAYEKAKAALARG